MLSTILFIPLRAPPVQSVILSLMLLISEQNIYLFLSMCQSAEECTELWENPLTELQRKKKNLLVLNFFFPLQQGHNVHKLQKRNESSLQTVRAGGRKREEIYRHQPAASADAGAFPAVPLLLSLL